MLTHEKGEEREWTFAERVSAAGGCDRDHLLIASQTGLWWFSHSAGAPQALVDLAPEGLFPDGAMFDAEGCPWNAHSVAGRVARHRPDGCFDRALDLPATQTTCPAFGGADLATLFVTSASVDLPRPGALQGCVFALTPGVRGLPEHRVRL